MAVPVLNGGGSAALFQSSEGGQACRHSDSVVCRAILHNTDQEGQFSVEFTGAFDMTAHFSLPNNALYIKSAEARLVSGSCALYFDAKGRWTVLQHRSVIHDSVGWLRHAATLSLKRGNSTVTSLFFGNACSLPSEQPAQAAQVSAL